MYLNSFGVEILQVFAFKLGKIIYKIRLNWKKKKNALALVRERDRPSDRRLSAKVMPIFADREVSRGQRGGSLRP
jgi:hypothetical protein